MFFKKLTSFLLWPKNSLQTEFFFGDMVPNLGMR